MQQNENKTGRNRSRKTSGTIDRAREDRCEDHKQDRIKGSFFREGPSATHPHHDKGNEENQNGAQGHLPERQFFWIEAKAQKHAEKISKRLH